MTRLKTYLTEWMDEGDIEQEDITAISNILHECSDMYELYKKYNKFFFRGVEENIETWTKKIARQERKPRAMGWEVKNYLDDRFQEMFGWRARNGVFATSDIEHVNNNFDNPYVIFVPNGFKYVWSTEFMDLNLGDGDAWLECIDFILSPKTDIEDEEDEDDRRLVKQYQENLISGLESFTNKDIIGALKSGNEISFKCKHYYLINQEVLMNPHNMVWFYNR